ncbi:MAG: hypothetical protein R2736_00535 [Solirubrobacterales bacterium]
MPVDVVLLRGLLPEVPIRAGDVLPARVLGPGMLSLAGVRVAARLPEGLAEGARLRLRVQEAGAERVVLRVVGRRRRGQAARRRRSRRRAPTRSPRRSGPASSSRCPAARWPGCSSMPTTPGPPPGRAAAARRG